MVIESTTENTLALQADLDWFYHVLDVRLKLHFGHDCAFQDVLEITPPDFPEMESMYGYLVHHYNMTFEERILLLLGLIPHLRPQLLDVFFTQNAANNREFTEFGGRNEPGFKGFLPTGETALFILAGDNLEKRLSLHYLFGENHFFARHHILQLSSPPPNCPQLSGLIDISREIVDLVTSGQLLKPQFSIDFPAKEIHTPLSWDDLVLNQQTLSQVSEISTWMEHGSKLLHEFGLGKTVKPGYRSLFYGPPGTGKTLTAALIGKSANRPIYRIDLSMVVSKYIGETEKNLEKIFRKAEHKDWILFFDEADALFGKRTNISDAHDRFANQEVSYLLQRVEDYAGVVILASNMKSNLDDAFTRRFQSIIHFPIPKREERLQLWEKAFSSKTVLEAAVKLPDIAGKYEIPGGAIINVVRFATLMALERESNVILLKDIINGIRREYQKEGKTF